MTDQKWQKVRAVFDAALRQKPEARLNYIKEACGDDLDLLTEVQSLLSSLDESDGFMETPAVAHVADVIDTDTRPLEPGTCFGHYEIIRQIGAGGMGDVYLAKDKRLDRRVAIKFLHKKYGRDESNLKRFVHEAKAASALNHPNILVIHEIGESEDVPYIVSEFIEGRTLREVLSEKTLKVSEVLDASIQIANALTAAHGAHLIHRDIKPENIMLRPDGYVKILDFGLAKLVGQENKAFLGFEESTVQKNPTAKGVILGTVNYMSPEQAKGESIDERSDIFSLGVVIYEMVAGRTAFAGDSTSETFANLLNLEPPPLSRFAANVSDELQRIVSRTLRKNKDVRYQTMRGVLTELKDLKESLTLERLHPLEREVATVRLPATTAGATVQTVESQDSLFQKIRQHKLPAALALIMLLAAIGLGVWRFTSRSSNATPPAIKSLAVIPLDNFTGDPAQEYLADGMTEALITELSKIGSLRVISRQSVMQYKAARKPLPEIARELNVDAIVTGSAQRSGDKILITAQLIRAATDQNLWANQYERDLLNVLSLQREVARTIAGEINVKLTPKEAGLLASGRPVNPEALDAYLKGRDYFNRGRDDFRQQGTDFLKTSVDYFEKAVRIDPNFALAYAGLGEACTWLASNRRLSEFAPRAKEAAKTALQIDETLAQAHHVLAYNLMVFDWDWGGAEREFKRAIELNPSYSDAHDSYAIYLLFLGRFDQMFRETNLVQELDPLTFVFKLNEAERYTCARQYDRAIEQFRRLLDTQPNHPQVHGDLGYAYMHKGMYEEGIAKLRKAGELLGRDASSDLDLAWGDAVSGNRSEALKILDEILKSSGGPVPKVSIAKVHTALGDKDQAFTWLEKAYQEHSDQLLVLKADPAFDSLRSDPRYHDFLRRIGFPQ